MTSRRNVLIRSITGLCGDIAVAVTVASACSWIIQYATLGLFLTFLVWMLGLLISLAISQLVVHPIVDALLSNRKLDAALGVVGSFGDTVNATGSKAVGGVVDFAKSTLSRMRTA